jgi:hypothetical protein
MPDQHFGHRLHLRVSDADFAAIERFRSEEALSSTADALRLLIEIALETVSAKGHRFWDKKPPEPSSG